MLSAEEEFATLKPPASVITPGRDRVPLACVTARDTVPELDPIDTVEPSVTKPELPAFNVKL